MKISTSCDLIQGNTTVYQDRDILTKLNNIQIKLNNFDGKIYFYYYYLIMMKK